MSFSVQRKNGAIEEKGKCPYSGAECPQRNKFVHSRRVDGVKGQREKQEGQAKNKLHIVDDPKAHH
ncbi:MAG: hypothetical protein JXA35_01435 [Deltaproteobacteria bacterium]|nr:hypothetical protein [Deltaproteobacteria bacterium]